jgi:diguanylate cyclase (GGDEF)-like protein/putative nucleotidyltransferase with HDIG domain
MTTSAPHAPTAPRRGGSRRARATIALAAAAAALLALSAFAAWVSLTTRDMSESVRRSSRLADAYQQARHALDEEQLTLRDYRLQPSFSGGERLRRAQARLDASLREIRRRGEARDRRLASAALRQCALATRSLARVVAAVQAGDVFAVDRIERRRLGPLFRSIGRQLDRSAETHRRKAQRALATSSRSEHIVLAAATLMFVLGLSLLVALAVALRLRHRLEESRRAELEHLTRAARTDNLTGLGNHRAFHEDLERLLTDTSSHRTSLVMLDLDGLKRVNDTLGHQSGDALITALAHGLHNAAGDGGAYRVGGDEFALVVRGGAMAAFATVQRLQQELEAADRAVFVIAGVAQADAGLPADEVVRRADLALIESKRARRRALVYSSACERPLTEQDARSSQRYTETLATALARAVDAKDASTRSHCETVAELCALMAEELGLPPEHIAKMRLAGLLHDVGKIGVPDSILQKPGPLTPEEFEVMKTHTHLGYHIVSSAELHEEARWILSHHERPDGTGYPTALRGDEVPLESRIIMVADSFEAMTAHRPYRAGRPAHEALAELERHVGTQFDARCVEALRTVMGGTVTTLPTPAAGLRDDGFTDDALAA